MTVSVLRYAFDQFAMGAHPAIIKPVLENFTNYSFFTGRALEGTYQQTLDLAERRSSQTSELAISISKAGESLFGKDKTVSPIDVDNFLKGYFGSAATTVQMATDQVLNPDRLDRPMHKYWMLSVFMYDEDRQSKRKDEAYEWNEKVGRRLATMQNLAQRDPDAAYEYYMKHEQEIVLAKALQEIFKQAGTVRSYINALTRGDAALGDMSKEERESEIKAAREIEREIFQGLRELRNEIRSQ
jgi:hypothetical protein